MELSRFDLFAAAELGDIAALERYFAQPNALAAALAVEAAIADDAIQDFTYHAFRENGIPQSAWVYLHDRATNIFHTVTYYHQYEVMRWFFMSNFSGIVPKTLQFFLLNAASLAIEERDVEMLEIVLTSPLFADSSRYPDSAREMIFPCLLRTAIRWKSERIVEVLTAHGADLLTLLLGEATPVSEAAACDGTGAVVRCAIDNGAIVVGDQEAIHRAVENDNLDVLLVLLDGGADPRSKDRILQTPLHRAAHEGLARIADVILKTTCSDIDARNSEGETALNVAVKENPDTEDAGDGDEDDPSHTRVVEVLLRHGADTELSCTSAYGGYTPLRWAVSMQSLPIVRKLLAAGANPHTKFGQSNESAADVLEYDMAETAEEILQLLALCETGWTG